MSSIYRLGYGFYKELIAAPYIEWYKQIQCHRQTVRAPVRETKRRLVGRCIVIGTGWLPVVNYVVHLARKFFQATSDDQLHDALENADDALAQSYLKSGCTFSKCSDVTIAKIFNEDLYTTLAYLRDEAPLSLFRSIKTFDALQTAVSPAKETFLSCFQQACTCRNTMRSEEYEQLKSKLVNAQGEYRLNIDHRDIFVHIGWALDVDCRFTLSSSQREIESEEKMDTFVASLERDFTISRCKKILAYILKETELPVDKKGRCILQCFEQVRSNCYADRSIYADRSFIEAVELLSFQKKWQDLEMCISCVPEGNRKDLISRKTIDYIYQNLFDKITEPQSDFLQLVLQLPREVIVDLFKKTLIQQEIGQMPCIWPTRFIKKAPEILDCICQNLPNKESKKAHGDLLKLILQLPKDAVIDLFTKMLSQDKIGQMPFNSMFQIIQDQNSGNDVFDILFENLAIKEIRLKRNVLPALKVKFASIPERNRYVESLKRSRLFCVLFYFLSALREEEQIEIIKNIELKKEWDFDFY